MTKENIELFRKDVAARLPYEPIVTNKRFDYGCGHSLYLGDLSISRYFDSTNIDDTKVYLRPMSSMTEEEQQEYEDWHLELEAGRTKDWKFADYIEWLNSHHLDYRGLVEKGLALEAPEGMYEVQD